MLTAADGNESVYDEWSLTSYSIVPEDPLSATVKCEKRVVMSNALSGLDAVINAEQTMTNANKSKQGPENEHMHQEMSKAELADERGGHGHSGHSGNRNGSRK